MPEPILVTGGLGAVGTYLVAELKNRGHTVTVMDVPHNMGPNYLRGDVSEYRQFESVIKKVKPKYVYHLAAEFGRWNGEDFYETMWNANAVGTKHLLTLAKHYGFRSVVFSMKRKFKVENVRIVGVAASGPGIYTMDELRATYYALARKRWPTIRTDEEAKERIEKWLKFEKFLDTTAINKLPVGAILRWLEDEVARLGQVATLKRIDEFEAHCRVTPGTHRDKAKAWIATHPKETKTVEQLMRKSMRYPYQKPQKPT